MDVLGRMPEAEFDGTHPAIPRRAKALRTLMVEQPSPTLAAEGRARLQGSSALTYTISERPQIAACQLPLRQRQGWLRDERSLRLQQMSKSVSLPRVDLATQCCDALRSHIQQPR